MCARKQTKTHPSGSKVPGLHGEHCRTRRSRKCPGLLQFQTHGPCPELGGIRPAGHSCGVAAASSRALLASDGSKLSLSTDAPAEADTAKTIMLMRMMKSTAFHDLLY